jgi:hypothetical protein
MLYAVAYVSCSRNEERMLCDARNMSVNPNKSESESDSESKVCIKLVVFITLLWCTVNKTLISWKKFYKNSTICVKYVRRKSILMKNTLYDKGCMVRNCSDRICDTVWSNWNYIDEKKTWCRNTYMNLVYVGRKQHLREYFKVCINIK